MVFAPFFSFFWRRRRLRCRREDPPPRHRRRCRRRRHRRRLAVFMDRPSPNAFKRIPEHLNASKQVQTGVYRADNI